MWLQLFAGIALLQAVFLLSRSTTDSTYRVFYKRNIESCSPSFSCGEILNITCPFKPQGSNSSGFPLLCQNNTTLRIYLTMYHYHDSTVDRRSKIQRPRFQGIYHVKRINLDSEDPLFGAIQTADTNFASNDSASSICQLPLYPLGSLMLQYLTFNPYWPFNDYLTFSHSTVVSWVRCSEARGGAHLDPATYLPLPCPDNMNNSSSSEWRPYLLLKSVTVAQLDRACQVVANMLATNHNGDLEGLNLTSIWSRLQMGFQLQLRHLCYFFYEGDDVECTDYIGPVRIDFWELTKKKLVWLAKAELYFVTVPRMLGMLCLVALLIHRLKKKYYSSNNNVEKLLQKCQNLSPRRYTYPEIQFITGHFREKLGQGGFGSVFKGSLFDGRPVAVKLLGKAKNGGRDFINEVATIGRIHHVNAVHLIGFCADYRRRALVYEFMPNGSLDKYILPGNNSRNHLPSWEMIYKIALGIGRGIEYLHPGCDMCILHFDIKPHNVLLDENFCPKISYFGLAKLSPTQNTMTLSGYRGTIGYIAPEQVSRNFGGVSYKSDVYSFGMSLKMAERTWREDVLAPGSTQIYFPSWIYDRLSEGQDVEIGEATETEKEIMKKLALVGLCCIQMKPANRPSMSQVIEMLEGSLDALHLPPKPFLMLADETPDKECSVLSICQSDTEQVTFYSKSKWSASSSRGAI